MAVADVSNGGPGAPRGQVTALADGTTEISAAFGGVTGKTSITVAAIKELQVTPTNASTPVGLRTQLTATALLANNAVYDATGLAAWTSSMDAVVSVSNVPASRGLASALSPGMATIRATLGSVSGQTV